MIFASFALGASPWILYNVRYSFPSLRENFAVRPASGIAEVVSNAKYFLAYNARELTVGLNPLLDGVAITPLERWLQIPAGLIYAASALTLIILPAILLKSRTERKRAFPYLLLWLILATVAAFYSSSEAGAMRGYTVRYVLPIYIPLVVGASLLIDLAWRRSRILAGVLASMLVLFHVSGYYLPWTTQRRHLRDQLRFDAELVQFLEERQLRWVCGNYWVVYPLVFESQRKILGIPFIAELDHYGLARDLPPTTVRWALVALDPGWLRQWVGRTGLQGQILSVGGGYHVFIPEMREVQARSNQKTLAFLQRAATYGY